MSCESKPIPIPLLRLRLGIQAADLLGLIFSTWSVIKIGVGDPRWVIELSFVCLSAIVNLFLIRYTKRRAEKAACFSVGKKSSTCYIILAFVDGVLAVAFLGLYLSQLLGSGRDWGIGPYYATFMCVTIGLLHLHACLSPFYSLQKPHYLKFSGSRSPSIASLTCQRCQDQAPPALGGAWNRVPRDAADVGYADQDVGGQKDSMEAAEEDRLLVSDLKDGRH